MDYKQILEKHLKEQQIKPKEEDLKLCKVCSQLKKRILIGKFDTRNKKWADESGKLWSGHYCPSCNVERTRELMKQKRNKVKNDEQI